MDTDYYHGHHRDDSYAALRRSILRDQEAALADATGAALPEGKHRAQQVTA